MFSMRRAFTCIPRTLGKLSDFHVSETRERNGVGLNFDRGVKASLLIEKLVNNIGTLFLLLELDLLRSDSNEQGAKFISTSCLDIVPSS